jgi:hypothetical protein
MQPATIWAIVAAALALGTLIVGTVDAVGRDHIHKRQLLTHIATLGTLFLFSAGAGAAAVIAIRHYHDRNPESESKAANKAVNTQSDKAQVTHDNAPQYVPPTAAEQPPEKLEASLTHNETKQHDAVSDTNKHPTLTHIFKTIEGAPPLQQDIVAKQFIGVPISWDVELWSGYEIGKQTRISTRLCLVSSFAGNVGSWPV